MFCQMIFDKIRFKHNVSPHDVTSTACNFELLNRRDYGFPIEKQPVFNDFCKFCSLISMNKNDQLTKFEQWKPGCSEKKLFSARFWYCHTLHATWINNSFFFLQNILIRSTISQARSFLVGFLVTLIVKAP